jgi:hypothetical protein
VSLPERGADSKLGGFSTCGVHVRLTDPSLVPELVRHFERSGFRVQRRGDALNIERPGAPSEDRAEREIRRHLDVWLLIVPGRDDRPAVGNRSPGGFGQDGRVEVEITFRDGAGPADIEMAVSVSRRWKGSGYSTSGSSRIPASAPG